MSFLRMVSSLRHLPFFCVVVGLALFAQQPWRSVTAQQATAFVTVSAASYRADSIAPESIVAGFGVNLSTQTASGRDSDPNTPGIQLPTSLVGTTVKVNNVAAPLFFVSPGQINYLIPPNTPLGDMPVEVTTASGATAIGTINVRQVAPAIFTANADGLGVPAALVLRVAANGAQTYENLSARNEAANRILATPINLGPEGEKVFLILYPTGLRRVPDPNNDGNFNEFTRVIINGLSIVPAYVGPQGTFVGLEQVNVEIPRSLLGSGALDVQIVVSGLGVSNTTGIELVAPPVTALSFRALGLPTRTIRNFATIGSYLFAATDQGVWCSSDSGTNWINVSTGLPTNADVRTLFVDGTTLYAGLYGGGGVCVSTNNGGSWTALNNGLVGSTLNISNLLLFGGRIYAATQGGVCRYVNGAWVALNSGLTTVDATTLVVAGGRLCVGTRGGGIFVLGSGNNWGSISTGLPSGAQVLSLVSAGTAVFAGLNGGGLCVSRNGGTSWTQVAGGLPGSAVINSIWVDGTRCYVGTATGVYVTNDSGTTWNPLSNGLSGCSGANNTNAVFAFASRLLTGSTGCGVYGSALAAGATNRAPIAYDQTVSFTEDTPIVISLSGFDADLDPLTYSIAAGTARGSLNGALPNITYTPNTNFSGRDAFTFRVSDGRQFSNLATISLEGRPINDAPTISSPATVTANAGAAVNFVITANDPDGDALTLTTSALPAGATFTAATRTFNWPAAVAGTYPITFTASDGRESRSSTTTINVNPAVVAWQPLGTGLNGIGTVWALYTNGATIYAGGAFGIWRSTDSGANWSVFSNGLNNDARHVLRFGFLNNRLFAATTGGLFVLNEGATGWTTITNGVPAGSIRSIAGIGSTIFVGGFGTGVHRSTDGGASFSPFATTGFGSTGDAIALHIVNDFLLAGTYGPPAAGVQRSAVSSPNWAFNNTAFGFDTPASFQQVGDTTYAGGSGFLYLSSDAGATWQRSATQAAGAGQFWNFVVTTEGIYAAGTSGRVYFTTNNGASWMLINEGITSNQTIGLIRDGNRLLLGGVNAVFFRPLSGVAANQAPVLTVPAAQTVTTGQALNFNVSATDPDAGQTVTLGATGMPQGATFNAATGAFAWTPTIAGAFTLTFSATDNGVPPLSATRTVAVTVTDAPPAGWAYRGGTHGGAPSAILLTSNYLLVGTSSDGIYRSANTGASFTASSTGLLNANVTSLSLVDAAIYAGTANGLHRSTNDGAVWARVDGAPAIANVIGVVKVGTILVAPTRSSGVYTSANNGDTWTLAANTGFSVLGEIRKVILRSNRAFLACDYGVFTSTDGVNWTARNNGIAATGNFRAVSSLAFIGDSLFALDNQGLQVSLDDGLNWTSRNNTSAARYTNLNSAKLTVGGSALFVSNASSIYYSSDQGVGFVQMTAGAPPIDGLVATATGSAIYVAADRGTTTTVRGIWVSGFPTVDANRPPVLTVPGAQTATVGQAVTFTVSATDPDAGQTLTYSATNLPSGATFNATTRQFSWTPASNQTGAFTVTFTVTDNGTSPLSDNKTVTITVTGGGSPTGNWTSSNTGLPENAVPLGFCALGNTVFVATNLGLFRTTNSGANWTQMTAGLTETNFLSISNVNERLFAGSRFNGLFASNDGGTTWTHIADSQSVFLGVVGVVGIGNTLVALGDGSLSATSAFVFVSTNNGQTWTRPTTNLPSGVYKNIWLKGSTIFVSGNSFGGVSDGVMRSENSGASWVSAGTGLLFSGGVGGPYYLAVKGTDLFVAGVNSGVARSTNDGGSWSFVSGAVLPVAATTYKALTANDTLLFAAGNQGVYFTANNGVAWTAMTGATVSGATSLLIVGTRVYAATSTGVYVSPLPGQ